MKTVFTFFWISAFLLAVNVAGSTSAFNYLDSGKSGGLTNTLNPTIINGNVILCPDGTETLMTQEYDSYQWHKDGNPVPGATEQYFEIDYYNYVGSSVSVFVTLGDESAMSPTIFVDGYMFLPVVVSSYGSGFWFQDEEWHMCEYHELFFEIMLPYTTHIQWYRDGEAIPDATQSVYQVEQTGEYYVSGAPAVCPDYVQYSLPLSVVVHTPPLPVISQVDEQLQTSVFPGQWYFGDAPIPGATGQFITPEEEGWYSFEFTDNYGCTKMSEPYHYEMPADILPGDANCDGLVNVLDVISMVSYFVGLNPDPFCFDNADVNGDGVINILDVILTVAIFADGNGGETGSVIDIDGNVYQTIVIGEQEWMAENLRTTRFADGSLIPVDLTDGQWTNALYGASAIYPHHMINGLNSDEEVLDAYGMIYNWYAVDDDRGLCPEGWYVPSHDEWTQLENYMISTYDLTNHHNDVNGLGSALKSCRQVNSPLGGDCVVSDHPRWNPHSTHYGQDLAGFGTLPAGRRRLNGVYFDIGHMGFFWTSSSHTATHAINRTLYSDAGHISGFFSMNYRKTVGYSVRCIKENSYGE